MGEAFGSRYHIIRLLGAGGMGAVYQAWDAELNVAVALKVIRPREAEDPAVAQDLERRFKRELLLARQVSHANVVRIHDLGDIDGIKYLTMTYVEGTDLSRLLAKDKLPLARALGIAKQVAFGLRAAHQVDVVHRDLKPANIMIAGDEALIMDFGIARSLSSGTMATRQGAVVGTVAYMAPEQARGEKADHRADIYAFGLILYDMLLGPTRSASDSGAVPELVRRMQQGVPDIRSLDPAIPEAVERIVSRCLHNDPAARYQKTAELVADLVRLGPDGLPLAPPRPVRRIGAPLIASLLAAMLVLVAGTWWISRRTPGTSVPAATRAPVSVLIANFENMTGDPVFEGSLEQVLALGIEGASFVSSFPRQNALQAVARIAPGRPLDAEAGRLVALREGVKVVLSGSIESSGSGYRIRVRALESSDGKALATAEASADGKAEVLKAVESVSKQIRRSLGDVAPDTGLAGAQETFTAASLDAVRAYSLAQDLASVGKEEQAIAQYQKALEHDPSFGRAYSGWATSAFRLGRRDEAERLWKQALSLLDRMTERERYRTLGGYYIGISRNYEKAIENYAALVEKYPGDGTGLNNLGVAYFNTLDFAKALKHGRRAVEIYPKNARWRTNVALYAMYAGDLQTAAAEAERVIGIPESAGLHKAYLPLAVGAALASKPDGARSAYERMAKAGPRGAAFAALGLADLALYEGRLSDAEKLLLEGVKADSAAKLQSDQAIKQIVLAETLALLGKTPEAITAAHEALRTAKADSIVVPAARLFVASGRDAEARALAAGLEGQLQKQSRAYARLIEAEIALRDGRVPAAVDALVAAKELGDLWQVRVALGRAYALAGQFPEALSELELAQKRQGEATAVFLDDYPSMRYLVPVGYWLARAQEGAGKKAEAAQSYTSFLARRQNAAGDPLAADARKRVEAK